MTSAPSRADWLMLCGIVLLGGASFAGIEVALRSAPPAMVGAGRLWVGAGFMACHLLATGRPFLSLRDTRAWGFAAGAGFFGYALPMILIPVAQQSVTSILASVYQAFMPVLTVLFAWAFADEAMTRGKAIGFALATAGVLLLVGPEALAGVFDANLLAQLLLIVAITGYAAGGVVMRRAPDVPARGFAFAFLLCAAVMATPFALASAPAEVSVASWAGIAFLGLGPTGLNAIFIILTVRRVGAGFTSLAAYGAPLVSLVLGVAFLGETVSVLTLLALALILLGVAVSQPGTRNALRAALPRRARRSRPAP